MTASNTKECFSECVGKRVVGVLFGALPVGDRDIASRTKTFVFDDGSGITFSSNGSFWPDSAKDVRRAVELKRDELNATKGEIAGVLALAGSLDS